MYRSLLISALFVLLCCTTACHPEVQTKKESGGPVPDQTVRYAKRFAIARDSNCTYVYLMGKRDSQDTTDTFILYRTVKPANCGTTNCIRIPCRNIAALSSIYAQAFYELNSLDAVKAIDNIDYVNNAEVLRRFRDEAWPELARTPDIDVERTITLMPDIVFTYGMGDGSKPDARLSAAGIPIAVSVDHLEETPLARAEWIKFYAAFVDKRELADSIFNACEKNYARVREQAENKLPKPTVFNEIKYSDAWYMPGGKSYIARLLKDAGASYLWADDAKAGSLPLSFEEVFAKAKEADYWIHLSTVRKKSELLSYEPRYAAFKAFKTGNLYNNTKYTNNKGYSVYWESGMLHPDRILSDLVNIFHPGVLPAQSRDLYYYEQVK
jgi:iron complex transport system substrate-binding protein